MKKASSLIFGIGITAILIITGCAKKEDVNTDNPAAPATVTTPSIAIKDSYGTLVAVRSVSYTMVGGFTIPVEVNTAVAAFPSAPGSTTLLDAGTVTINSKGLTKQNNNAYVYQNLTSPLDFSDIIWNVSGSGAIPAISYTDNKPIPDYSGYTDLPASLTRSAGLEINLAGKITGADSVYVIIADVNSKYLLRRLGGGASKCSFTPADLATLSAGTGMLQVVPWNYDKEDFSDKPFYFVIESVYTKSGVTIN